MNKSKKQKKFVQDWSELHLALLQRIPIHLLERDCTQRRLHQSFNTLMFLNFNVVLLASYADMTAQPTLKLLYIFLIFLPKNKRKAGICNYCSTLVVDYHLGLLISSTRNRACCFSVLLGSRGQYQHSNPPPFGTWIEVMGLL